jgi:hypothetical protein
MLGVLARPNIDVGLRNRVLYDSMGLIENDKPWNLAKEQPAWSFNQIEVLKARWMRLQSSELREDLRKRLGEYVARVERDTCESFAAFKAQQEHSEGFSSVDEFAEWFFLNLPYAGLELEGKPFSDWLAQFKTCVGWMMEQGKAFLDAEDRYLLEKSARSFLLDQTRVAA